MVSKHTRARAAVVATVAAVVLLLAGCAGKTDTASGDLPSPTITATTPTATPTATGTPTATTAPTSPATTAPGGDPAAAKASAVQSCQAVQEGFSAGNVAAALPLATAAAGMDSTWQRLASNLQFIHDHPIDPDTGAGPQQTVDDSTAVAHDCFTLAGVTVSQD
jgi:hypothetical protein